ncbi:hypothetical protein BX616_003265 [Lobosporangium transversale]|uniref:Arrestin-like N-terminal domain-containing protein n=1 Tax=Lobosporangium transversale TaxID=64571 RepID=A0A1Y2GY31_9FUNG|nr:hypothetical protein BCR41DRAFT_384479 [Lobosporangium transversale]KAF9899124.1 hypothetical protein BX616_003265 [Lobosporangium transversale]ORZ26383.1 hypothetical protein BCR41DRAFT_384479 [Lobosporangium transversale]|eukprot:XP_021884148.1 hypothetical protein BCR41DRAFT_384479 [Lobosporangium transversale]
MNFLFATDTPAQSTVGVNHNNSMSAPAAATQTPASNQDIELVIDIESSFHGVLVGLPEESTGAVLNATAILHVRKKPIRATKLMATFDGRIKVQCSDGATFGPEQYRERVLAHKDWILWEAGGSNTHTESGSKNHIPIGTHYYPISIQLDGALPPTFSGKHGSIRYILSSSLLRPLFYSDINSVQEIEIKRCLVGEAPRNEGHLAQHTGHLDLGSLLVNQLSRAGISGALNEHGQGLAAQASNLPLGPTTITHHKTHKELLRYTASSPPIAHLEGGLIQVDLTLEPLPPGSYIYSIAYGLKEVIYYRSSATGNQADNKSEIVYPIGQQTVIIPRDLERERAMSSAGAGASTRQLLELRPCPLLTNVDIITPLIEVQHRIVCNVVIVLPETIRRRNTLSGSQNEQNGASTSGAGSILRRLNLAPQPSSPSLNLVDSNGTDVLNNAVFLGEPTHSIIEPARAPATIELNDSPPPPPSSQLESTLLEFPIILTSRYPSSSRVQHQMLAQPIVCSDSAQSQRIVDGNPYQPLPNSSFSESLNSRSIAISAPHDEQQPVTLAPQQFVHNQEIPPTIIPTTGTTVQTGVGPTLALTMSESPSSSLSSMSSSNLADETQNNSSSSSQASPFLGNTSQDTFTSGQRFSDHTSSMDTVTRSLNDMRFSARAPTQSGISAGLRAAANTPFDPQTGHQPEPSSRPPSYGRQVPQSSQSGQTSQEEPPKYEDLIDISETPETGLGITLSHTMPVSMPMQVPRRGYQVPNDLQSMNPYSFGLAQSPLLSQTVNSSYPRNHVLSSSFSSSPISSPNENGGFMARRDSQGSSPQAMFGRSFRNQTGSTILSTSLSRSPEHSYTMPATTFMPMTPVQPTAMQSQACGPTSIHRQASLGHRRQRSVGTATIIGSLGRNGGYLSQQPIPLSMTDIPVAAPVPGLGERNISPPAYADV